MKRLVWFIAPFICLAPQAGCDDDNCDGGRCGCTTGDYCYLACEGEGCDLSCGQMPECGGICEDDCRFHCNDVTQCSALCEADCQITCERLSSCGAICGERCNYSCSGADRCGVEVGAGSVVDCSSVSSCDVVCNGPCSVRCSGVSTGACNVTCESGTQLSGDEQERQCVAM